MCCYCKKNKWIKGRQEKGGGKKGGGGGGSMSRENKLIKTMVLNKTKHLPLIIEEARQRAACAVGISFV